MDTQDVNKRIEQRLSANLRAIKAELDTIVKSTPNLSEAEKGFVKARYEYWDANHHKAFAGLSLDTEVPTEQLTYKELQEKAKELGLKYNGVSREELEEALANA